MAGLGKFSGNIICKDFLVFDFDSFVTDIVSCDFAIYISFTGRTR